MNGLSWVAAWCAAIALAAASAAADGSEKGDLWHLQVTPSMWAARLDGDVATLPGLPKANVDASVDDLFDHGDLSFTIQAEARYRRVGAFADLAFLSLTADGRMPPGELFGAVDFDTQTFFATLAASYRAIQGRRLSLDLVGGARIWSVSTKVSIESGPLAGQTDREEESWADPILGARASLRLFGPLSLSGAADVGGFGASSELTWQALGSLDLRPWSWLVLRLGYRYLAVEYDHGKFGWDVAMSGPILGGSFRF